MSALRGIAQTTRTRAPLPQIRDACRGRMLSPLAYLCWAIAARRPGPTATFEGVDHHPWCKESMDEPTGEVLDVRIRGYRGTIDALRHEWSEPCLFFSRRRFARLLTKQESWASRDRDEEWRDDMRHRAEGDERHRLSAPAQAPAWWEPDDEWDPAWEFCGPFAAGSIPVVFGGYDL